METMTVNIATDVAITVPLMRWKVERMMRAFASRYVEYAF